MRLLVLTIIIFLLAGCNKKDLQNITEEAVFPSLFQNPCFDVTTNAGNDELIIRDQKSFEAYVETIRIDPFNLSCDTVPPPHIDFDNYILVGKHSSGGGCDVSYERKIFKDKKNKQIIYKIRVRYKGLCDMLITSMNWVLIPKIPEGYTIEFSVDER